MLFVYGSGDGRSVMGETPMAKCGACGQTVTRTAVVFFKYWHLWYLFSFLTGRDYVSVCNACGATAPMEKADAKANFPRDNIPFVRKRGWALCLGILFCIVVASAVSSSLDGERLRALLETPAVGDSYQADLSKIPGSGYKLGGDAMYGGIILVEKLDDGRFVAATSDTAFERKRDLRKAIADDLQYSVSYNEEDEPLTLSQEELMKLWSDGILYEGVRQDLMEVEDDQPGQPEADRESVASR